MPLLIGLWRFGALEAVILNKALSLVVVATALPFRTDVVSFSEVLAQWGIIATLLSGSVVGAWCGAGWATRMKSERLYKVLSVLLVCIAGVLLLGHGAQPLHLTLAGWALTLAGVVAGVGIGMVASLLGVAGGELLIPTIVLLFGADLKVAGSLSLAVSLPTMMTAFTRSVAIKASRSSVASGASSSSWPPARSPGRSWAASCWDSYPRRCFLPLLVAILLASAVKVWRHRGNALWRRELLPQERPVKLLLGGVLIASALRVFAVDPGEGEVICLETDVRPDGRPATVPALVGPPHSAGVVGRSGTATEAARRDPCKNENSHRLLRR